LAALVGLQAPRWDDASLKAERWLADPARMEMMFAGVEPALPQFLERFGSRIAPEDAALAERIAPEAAAWVSQMTAGPAVVVHGDYRLDNLVFPRDGASPVTVFDWQAVRLGLPLVDACLYLGGCLPISARREHERDLLHEYHRRLLAERVRDFSFDQLWESYRWCVFYGLMLTIPFSAQVERTERNDALYGVMIRGYSQQALDLESERLLHGG
jgi:hypothetical protein